MAMKPKSKMKKQPKKQSFPCADCPNPERCMKMGTCMKKAMM